jgi:hypothetical protein
VHVILDGDPEMPLRLATRQLGRAAGPSCGCAQRNDPLPPRGYPQDAPDRGRAFRFKKTCANSVCRDHEILNQVLRAVVASSPQIVEQALVGKSLPPRWSAGSTIVPRTLHCLRDLVLHTQLLIKSRDHGEALR